MAMVAPGDLLGDALRVEALLGAGGGGSVFLATDVFLGRKVAVKVLPGVVAESAELLAQFQSEAQALARVRSDHVAQAYAMGPRASTLWLAMEYVDGSSLAEIVRQHAANGALVPVNRALSILRQIASGLAAVHRAKLVHRDVKPANVVVETHTGRPVLVDFGLAVASGTRQRGVVVGTASYMAPEQSFGEDVTAQTDLYALGVTAFELLTGELPYRGETMIEILVKHAVEEMPRVSRHRPELAPFDEVVGRALAKAPGDRYPSGDAVSSPRSTARSRGIETRPTIPPLPEAIREATLTNALRILVVDDDPAFRRLALRFLEARFASDGVQLFEAADGESALAAAQACEPDLVLLDFEMPGLDGIQTLTELRRLPRGQDARVVVVSASVEETERWRFSVLGVSDFLRKPISGGALVATVARIVGRL